jgi:manganese-dependent inorganic pyrophosphatase
MTTYIIGHRKPDTDSVVGALAFKFIFDNIPSYSYTNTQAVISHPLNSETEFVFKKFKVTSPKVISSKNIKKEDGVVLVDHNETDQRLEGLKDDQIVGIFDHHKTKINFNQPINIIVRAWGSTCTLAWDLIKKHNLEITEELAQLMTSAIISDTVNLKSPTTTEMDEKAVKDLNLVAQIDNLDDFALELFKTKSDISKLSDKQIVQNDYKIYQFGDKKVYISQVETVEQQEVVDDRGEGLKKALKETQEDFRVDLAFTGITDVLKVNTKLLVTPESKEIAEKTFDTKSTDGILDIGPKLSRKKEIAPAIEKTIQNG